MDERRCDICLFVEKNCKNCDGKFEITNGDLEFYKKIDVPEPTFCYDCRLQRRLAFRNENALYKRDCDLCKRKMVSFFDADVEFPVYCSECWWSDKWDPLEYGRDFDFDRPFFEQFNDLLMNVPKTGMLHMSSENSEYNTLIAYSKNAYMSPGSYFLEDCYYLGKSQYCKNCVNGNFLDHCELVAYSINCKSCYNCSNLVGCRDCSDSSYLFNCSGCRDCFMCSDITGKRYVFKNKVYSKEEYENILDKYRGRDTDELMKEFEEFKITVPKKYQNQINCENSSGDYIQNCKNAADCYDCFGVEDGKYIIDSVEVRDSMDLSKHDKNIEFCYEVCSGGESNYNLKFSFCSCASPNSSYLYSCFYTADCFGCDSIHSKNKYCILNKQYTKEEYEDLKKKIIEHMKKTGEYGEFFPISMALHPYNDSIAYDFFPLSKEKVLEMGCKWSEGGLDQEGVPSGESVPKNIEDVGEGVTKEIFGCEDCGKNFKILLPELKLCKRISQPLSPLCVNCRQKKLRELKNPRKLWDRSCDKCDRDIQTTYAPDRPEKVYCEECYLKEVY